MALVWDLLARRTVVHGLSLETERAGISQGASGGLLGKMVTQARNNCLVGARPLVYNKVRITPRQPRLPLAGCLDWSQGYNLTLSIPSTQSVRL